MLVLEEIINLECHQPKEVDNYLIVQNSQRYICQRLPREVNQDNL